MISDFERMTARLRDALSALAETQDRMSEELARGLILSTGMMRDLNLALDPQSPDIADPPEF